MGNALGWWLLVDGGGARYHHQEKSKPADIYKNSTGEAKKSEAVGANQSDFVRVRMEWIGMDCLDDEYILGEDLGAEWRESGVQKR